MTGEKLLALLGRAETNALISLSVHNQLLQKKLPDEARLLWVMHLQATANAEILAEALGVEAHLS